ncbi:hypothetical protein I7I53_00137 [Histoplasma capsulatum var. duboisii H88]|uniref:Uncharacterized protein n=1 Tax=Ajellomyces capsulatus (strain H88) TaxID=544711 RepID=A0A8A1LJ83_AJEC8|nr:hypothetical protein I7I53_00137 [Histoplasma capsulatum var. duboisii H88]
MVGKSSIIAMINVVISLHKTCFAEPRQKFLSARFVNISDGRGCHDSTMDLCKATILHHFAQKLVDDDVRWVWEELLPPSNENIKILSNQKLINMCLKMLSRVITHLCNKG